MKLKSLFVTLLSVIFGSVLLLFGVTSTYALVDDSPSLNHLNAINYSFVEDEDSLRIVNMQNKNLYVNINGEDVLVESNSFVTYSRLMLDETYFALIYNSQTYLIDKDNVDYLSASLLTNPSFTQIEISDNSTRLGLVRTLDDLEIDSTGQIYFVYESVPYYLSSTGLTTDNSSLLKVSDNPVVTNYVFDGTKKVGLNSGTGYVRLGTYEAINAGTYKASAELKTNYIFEDGTSSKKELTWTIEPLDASSCDFEDIEDQVYTGQEINVDPVIKMNGLTLINGTDYDLSFENNINVGIAKVNISFKGNYKGEASKDFNIVSKLVTSSSIRQIKDWTYTGSTPSLTPTVSFNSKILELGTDYEIDFSSNPVDVGTYEATVNFINNYKGSASFTYNIVPTNGALSIITYPNENLIYSGREIVPTLTVKLGSKVLESDVDYDLVLPSNVIDAGLKVITVKYKGNYKGEQNVEYTISRCNGTDLHSQLSNESFVYDGSEHKPSVTLTNGSNVLVEGTDYDLEYESDIVNAGTKDIYVYFKGNYQNTLTLNYEINPKDGDSNALWIETNQTSFVYNGSEQYPVIALYDSDRFTYLIENEDFFINYPEDLVSAGTKIILIEFDRNYSSTKEISYVITPISSNLVIHSISNQTYTGSYLTPDVQITHNNDLLVKGKDYDLSYSNNVNVGNASVYVSFKGNYSSNKITSFKIVPLLISEIDVDETDKIYTGSEIKVLIHIEHNGYVLIEGTDYITTYTNNINVGHASLLITLMGNYEGEFARHFNIKSKNLSSNDVYIEPQFKYTGEEIKPNVRILDGNYLLELNKDYTLTYSSDVISTGIKNVYITYIGNYEGSNQTTFEIVNRGSEDIDCSVEDITYSGIYLMPTVTCKVEDNLLEEGRDYDLDYLSNLNVGTGKVIITFKGNYTGSKELSFKINQLDISNLVDINLSQDSFIYDEQEHSPTVEIRYNNKVLTYIQDYTLSYPSDLVSAGDKVINIVFKQNYTGATSTTYKIVKTSIEPTTNIPETIRINSAYQIVFTSESTGKITYSSNNNSLLTVDEFGLISVNNILDKVILTINVEEDNNYSSFSKDYEIEIVLDKGFIINKDDINYGYDLLESALEDLEDYSLIGVTDYDKNVVIFYNKVINTDNNKNKYINALFFINNQDDLDDLDNRLDLLINTKNELLNRSNYIKYKDLYDASISELEGLDAIYNVEDLNNLKELVINKTDFNDLREEKINYIDSLKDSFDDEELINEYKSNLNDLDYDINLSNILNNKKITDLVEELVGRLNIRSIYKTDKANIRLNIEGLKNNHPLCISYINSKLEEFDNLVIDESKSNEDNRLVLEAFLSDVVTGIVRIEDLDNKTNLINNLKTDINNYTSSLIKTGKYNESKQDELNDITNKYIKQLDDLDLEMSLDDFNTNLLKIKTNYDQEIIIVDVSKVEEKTTYNNQDIDVVIINDDGIQNINNLTISLVDDSTTLSDKIVASFGNEVSDVDHALVDKEVLMRLDINITEVIDESSLYRVEINLPNELENREHLLVIYQRDDGTIEVYNTVVENDKLVFNTSHFSSFYILADQIVSLYWAIYLLSAVVVILLIAIIIKIISDKKKRNNSSLYSISILPILVSQLIPNNALLIIIILSVLILILSAILVGLFVRSYSKDNDYVNASSRNKEIEESFTHVNLLKGLKNSDKQEEPKNETIPQEDQTEQVEEETTEVVQEVEEEQIEVPQEHVTEEVTKEETQEVVELPQEENTEESTKDSYVQEKVEESTGNIEETDLVVQDEEPQVEQGDNVETEETPTKEAQDSNEEIINNQEEVIDPDYELEEEPYIEEDENKVEQIQFDEDYELEEEPYIESLKLESVAVEEVDALMTDETAESMVETSSIIQDISHKSAINVDTLNKNFNDGDEIDIEKIKKVIKRFDRKATYVKVLGRGRIDKKLIITADEFSLDAVKMILLLGGRVIKTSKPVELVNEDIKEENKKSNLQRISLLEDDYTDVYEEQESINKSNDEDNYVSSNYEKMSLLDEDNPLIEEHAQEEIKEEPKTEEIDTNEFIDEVEPDNKDYEEYYYEEVPQHIKDYEEESESDYEMYQQFFGEKSDEEQEESELVEEDITEEELIEEVSTLDEETKETLEEEQVAASEEETEEVNKDSEENYEESIENEVEEPIVEESPTKEEAEEVLEENKEEPTEEVQIEEEVREQVDDSNWEKLEIFDREDSPLQDEYHEEVESVNVDYLNSIVNKEEHMENYEDYYNSQGEESSVEDINPVVTQEEINEYYEEYPLDNNESDNEEEKKEEPLPEEVEQEQIEKEIEEPQEIIEVDTNSFIDEVEPDNEDYEDYYYEEVPQHIKDYEEESEDDYEMYQQFFGEKSNEGQEEPEELEEENTTEKEETEENIEEEQVERRPLEEPSTTYNDDGKIVITSLLNNDDQTYEENSIREIREELPQLNEVSVEEVDKYMSDEVAESLVEYSSKKVDKTKKTVVNLDELSEYFEDGDEIDLASMKKKIKKIDKKATYVKVLSRGKLDKRLIITADDFSLAAEKMILLLGGRVIRNK